MTRRILAALLCIGYVFAFLQSYYNLVAPYYSYMGYIYVVPPLAYYLASIGFAVLPVIWMPIEVRRPSHVLNWIIYVAVYIPSSLIPILTISGVDILNIMVLSSVLCVSFFVCCSSTYLPLLKSNFAFRVNRNIHVSILLVLFTMALVVLVIFFGWSLKLESLSNVYHVRTEFKSVLGGEELAGYVIHWFDVISALLIAVGVVTKDRRILILVGLFGEFYIYSITGFQSSALSIMLILSVTLALVVNKRFFGVFVLLGLTILISVSAYLDYISGSHNATSLLVRRLLATPGLLTGYYFEYFTLHRKALYAYSILKYLYDNPYTLTPPHLVGLQYFGSSLVSANANMFADGFANLGYMGMIVISFVYALYAWIFDSLSNHKPYILCALWIVIPGFSLVNGGLFTSLLTHGMLLSLILLWLYPIDRTRLEIAPSNSLPVVLL